MGEGPGVEPPVSPGLVEVPGGGCPVVAALEPGGITGVLLLDEVEVEVEEGSPDMIPGLTGLGLSELVGAEPVDEVIGRTKV